MCGFLFYLSKKELNLNNLKNAHSLLKHRGPDSQDEKYIKVNDSHLYVAHSRLKILDLSENANQPFISSCKRYILIFNGEIYNYKDLRKKYPNFNWRTNSDTEVLLCFLINESENALNNLVGMFSFCFVDLVQNKVIYGRDRFGIKPLYIYKDSTEIIISSEIPPILYLIKKCTANIYNISRYLLKGEYDVDENTFFNDIYAVNQGYIGIIDLSSQEIKIKKWYELRDYLDDNISNYSSIKISNELENLLDQSISTTLVSDVPIGFNVSGGADSAYLISYILNNSIDCKLFTQSYIEPYNEIIILRQIAKNLDIYECKNDSENIWSEINSCVKSQAEPFGGGFVCGYSRLYSLVRKNETKVILDGNGIDEILLGYTKYQKIINNKSYKKNLTSIDGSIGVYENAIGELIYDYKYQFENSIKYNSIREVGLNDLLKTKMPRALRFNDRVSMMHSCELRVPFLDHRLVEFCINIPENYLVNNENTKILYRNILAKRLKMNNLNFIKKNSIQLPQREWFKNEWMNYMWDILNDRRTAERGFINIKIAKDGFSKYLAGNNTNSFYLWQWLNLELWAREFLDK